MTITDSHLHEVEWGIEHLMHDVAFGDRYAVHDRVAVVAAALLIDSGLQGLKSIPTAEIARYAKTTESTMFRHFKGGREEILKAGVDWCWSQVNQAVFDAEFESGFERESLRAIERTFDAVFRMFESPFLRLAGTGAFLSYRRSEKIQGDERSEPQVKFERRLISMCEDVASSCSLGPSDGVQMSAFLTNYAAACWYSWLIDEASYNKPGGLMNRELVLRGVTNYLETVQMTCAIDPHAIA